jgi:DNA-binding beta-propeller fold protein YncE
MKLPMNAIYSNYTRALISAALMTASIASSHNALAAPEKAWSLEGFDEPESVQPHPTKPLLYVSNINGKPTELNGKGYISLLSSDGKVIRHGWVMGGMDAPKGLGIDDTYLYVADMQTLHIIDHEQGKLIKSIKADSSVMLNDVVVDDKGVVYISDLLGGGIYTYTNDTLSQWVSSADLPHPNGLFFANNTLTVGTWGEGLKDDFTTEKLGSLYTIDRSNKRITPYKNAELIGNLDGVAATKNAFIISDWMSGNIFKYENKKTSLLFNAGQFSADIAIKGKHLYVPMMFSKRIDTYTIGE